MYPGGRREAKVVFAVSVGFVKQSLTPETIFREGI